MVFDKLDTSLDFEWSKRVWFANWSGLLKFLNRDPEVQPFENLTNGPHFVKKNLKPGQKCTDFE